VKLSGRISLFLSKLVDTMAVAAANDALKMADPEATIKTIGVSVAPHDDELWKDGFTVALAVHSYSDVCQVVTELAREANAAISDRDFHILNQCLDDAVAGSVTAYALECKRGVAVEGKERLGVLAHEMRNLLNTATLSFEVIKKGIVGVAGSTAAMHSRSLSGLRVLVERSLAEVRLEVGLPRLERLSVAKFMQEIEDSAVMQAEAYSLQLKVESVDSEVAIDADRQLLASAVSNLLQNAFKFTPAGGTVSIVTRAIGERVQIDVCDECGGLPPGKTDELFRPFSQRGADRSGLGLGLSIALSAIRANSGDISVRDVPGKGCVFTVDLPRQAASL
jgi:signal transduction histidine kinase